MDALLEVFSYQQIFISAQLDKYENEFQTIKVIQNSLNSNTAESHSPLTLLGWLKTLEKSQSKQQPAESRRLREQGNQMFKAREDKLNILRACQLYTKAIFVASPNDDTLCLAYANRAIALQQYGYYRMAYDDCECALEFGYPKHMQHKIVLRQAYCAWKLNDADKLKHHLHALQIIEMNQNSQIEYDKLCAEYQELLKSNVSRSSTEIVDAIDLHRDSQKIVESTDAKGRYMIATKNIAINDIIFVERAASFVPINNALICQQCAATLLIPKPCPHCNGQAVYCSRKCRNEHAFVHIYECRAYQLQLFEHIGISHLAFRTMLEGIQQILPSLRNSRNAEELWQALLNADDRFEYTQTLRMTTHLDKMAKNDLLCFALAAQLLKLYLQHYTKFFDIFDNTEAAESDWHLITAALILRHIGQLIVNGHVCVSITPMERVVLLSDEMMSSAYHFKRGKLHQLSNDNGRAYSPVASMNLPYLSICNHSCEQLFQPKFSGRYVSTYAMKHINIGDEIHNCYTLDCRKSTQIERSANLEDIYHFKCDCIKCQEPDADYNKFHIYRCDQPNCRREFVPHPMEQYSATSGSNDSETHKEKYIRCTECNSLQKLEWYAKYLELLHEARSVQTRQVLFDSFHALDQHLVDYHETKLFFAGLLLNECFEAHNAGWKMEDAEFHILANINKFYLRGIAAQHGINTIEYVTKLTYLWDMIALGKYKCTKGEINEMLSALEILSDEWKMIFLNYYFDYVEHLSV